MQINEKLLLIITTVLTLAATLFCLIALATPRWSIGAGLFCTLCPKASAGLTIIAFLLFILITVVLILFILNILPKSIRIFTIILIFLATMFSLAAYASYFDLSAGYSFKLMVFTHFLSYIASLFVAFWLGGSYTSIGVVPNNA